MNPTLAAWLNAFRLRTLPLALASILSGSAIAFLDKVFSWPILLWALGTTILLQVLSNLANDYGDYQNGADNAGRIGPQRTVQAGLISPAAMKKGMMLCGILAFASGLALLWTAFGDSLRFFLFFLLLGLASIAAAVFYTAGKKPYGYRALGDLSVFLFFGLIGVMGVYILYSRAFSLTVLITALAVGASATAVLNLNNMRDLENDLASGKRTMAGLLGFQGARNYHIVLLLLAFIGWEVVFFMSFNFLLFFVAQVLFLLFIITVIKFGRVKKASEYDALLKPTALSSFILALGYFILCILVEYV
jgi:1,4-dihydroxy-2-naphthoate octaprenyltransferase